MCFGEFFRKTKSLKIYFFGEKLNYNNLKVLLFENSILFFFSNQV